MLSHIRDTTDVAEVSPPLPSLLPPTLCSAGFAEALAVTKGDGFFLKAIGLASKTANAAGGWRETGEMTGWSACDSNLVDLVHPGRD